MLTNIFEPGTIAKMTLKNRIVMPPLQTRGCDEEGFVTPALTGFLEERAVGGVGLIIMQHSFCWPSAKLQRGLALYDDKYIPRLKELTEAVKRHGTRIAIQLGGRGIRGETGQESVAPSAIAFSFEAKIPRELTAEDIDFYIQSYISAAQRVQKSGFDALEIHGTHGKLISQFLSPYTNRRKDEYGGDVEGRTLFPRRIVKGIKEKLGNEFPVIFRMNGDDYLEGGITIDDAKEQVRLLEAAGVDAFHVSGGAQEANWFNNPSYFYPGYIHAHLAEQIKKTVKVPVIAVGKIDIVNAERILKEKKADFVAIGRPLIADPWLIKKAGEGRIGDIRRCIYCLNCSTWGKRPRLKNRGFSCTVNPSVLREKEFTITPADNPKKIMVIGGGLAGMEAARTLAERGHEVHLYEQNDCLGGQWVPASWVDFKTDYKTLIPYLARGMEKNGVKVSLNTRVTRELLEKERPEEVVLATGAVARELNIDKPLKGGPEIVQGVDIITGKAETGERVVVIGGRYIGMEVAEDLAMKGKNVSVVEAFALGHGTNVRIKGLMINRMAECGVHVYENSPVLRISTQGLDIANNGIMLSLKADTVVLAVGSRPVNDLADLLNDLNIRFHAIGDCSRIGDALDAIADGAETGRAV